MDTDVIAPLLSLDDQVAIVTGAATGIGEGIARLLCAAGATVVVADVDATGADRVAGALREAGGRAEAVVVDVTDHAAVDAAWGRVWEVHGGIDVLVNNAGSYLTAGPIYDLEPEVWRRLMAVNLDSLYHCSRAAVRRWIDGGRRGARIVNIASVDGLIACIGVNYDAAKAGAIHFSRSLAVDVAPHGIRVNAVAPGYVQVETLARIARGELPPVHGRPTVATGLNNPVVRARVETLPRPGTPEDIARAVLFLSTEASSYVTGQVLAVDGGWSVR
jgi:NAD(P)-dependent dehydrogenase (short-subunit alcohol dehydrogenase family)